MKKYILIAAILTCLLVPVVADAQINSLQYWKRLGSFLTPVRSGDKIGSTTVDGYFRNLTLSGGTAVSGSGASTQVAFFSSSSNLTSNSGLTYTTSLLSITPTSTFAGRVGIGTTTPGSFLHIQGVTGGALPSLSAATVAVFQRNATTANQVAIDLVAGSASTANGLRFSDNATGRGYVYYDHSLDALSLGAAALDGITINSSQNVGIGTSTPAGKLHVLDSAATALFLLEGSTQSAEARLMADTDSKFPMLSFHDSDAPTTRLGGLILDRNSSVITGTSQNDLALFTESGSSQKLHLATEGVSRLTIGSTGLVGIGTSTPSTILMVNGSSSQTTYGGAGVANQGIHIVNLNGNTSRPFGISFGGAANTSLAGIYGLLTGAANNTRGDLAFAVRTVSSDTNLTEIMRINALFTGVGIMTPNPSSTLHVNGSFRVGTGQTPATSAGIVFTTIATSTINFGSTLAGNVSTADVTTQGATDGDSCAIGVPSAAVTGIGHFDCYVSGNGTTTIRFVNPSTAAALDPANGTFRVLLVR